MPRDLGHTTFSDASPFCLRRPIYHHYCIMADSIQAAIQYKTQHPQESYLSVAARFDVPKSTLYDRHTRTHLDHAHNAPRHLSVIQEEQLVLQVNAYAERGTLLTPAHIRELAQAIRGRVLGVNWVSRFIDRHSDRIHSRFFTYRELARLQADTPEIRQAFYTLERPLTRCEGCG